MQPNDYTQPPREAYPNQQPGLPPQPAPLPQPNPAPTPYSPELAAQLIGRPVAPAQPIPQPPFTPPPAEQPLPQPFPAGTVASPPAAGYGQPYATPQAASLPPAQYAQPQPAATPPTPRRRGLLWGGLAALVVLLAAGGYLLLSRSQQSATDTGHTASNANHAAQDSLVTSRATGDISRLKTFTLVAPGDNQLHGLKVITPPAADHLTVLTSSDGSCSLGFGTLSPTALAGSDVGNLVASAIASAKKEDANLRVTGPNKVAALVLKATDGHTYALPTVNYSFTDTTTGGGSLAETYSAYQLADHSHVVIYSSCASDKANDQAALTKKLNALQPVAKAITLKLN